MYPESFGLETPKNDSFRLEYIDHFIHSQNRANFSKNMSSDGVG